LLTSLICICYVTVASDVQLSVLIDGFAVHVFMTSLMSFISLLALLKNLWWCTFRYELTAATFSFCVAGILFQIDTRLGGVLHKMTFGKALFTAICSCCSTNRVKALNGI